MSRYNLGRIPARFAGLFDKNAARLALVFLGTFAGSWPVIGNAATFCPDVYHGGKFRINFNPAFTQIASYKQPNGSSYDGLLITSFFNVIKNPNGVGTTGYFERDLVARITGIGYRSPLWFNATRDTEILTDLDKASPVKPSTWDPADPSVNQTNWPNEAQKVPDGILPFEAIAVPQGFHPAGPPGRLTLINLDTPGRTSYIVDQSLQKKTSAPCVLPNASNFDPLNQPRFYHLVKWFDMDGDGLKDIVTVRSGFKVSVQICFPAVGEVVWFKNPGAAINPTVEWEEHVIAGYPTSTYAADITLDMADFEGDGVPEIVGTNFFTGKLLSLYGAPIGQTWANVNTTTNLARIAQISSNLGAPFGVYIVDLNRDGKLDILATNHQADNCHVPDPITGKVYALEQPANGDIFGQPWVTHIIKDNIRPNPSFPKPTSGTGRLAPGLAQPFWPSPFDQATSKPWLLVGGDEASKVWLLKPDSQATSDWSYSTAVIFDINDYYGPNTTQTFSAPAPSTGETISTIGTPSWRYDRGWAWASYAEIYIPVFEGRDIVRINFRPGSAANKITCPADTVEACPAP